ncbi:Delta(24)-sterol C-methyltransferase [Mortierella sp. AD094]|nr:Delta(24)-sterol C-methyltransferase [Mortierella sp. AD094]
MSPARTSTVLISQRNKEDLALSQTLHGNSWNESHHQDSLISKLKNKDRQFTPNVIDNYLDNWKEVQPENETEEAKTERQNSYKDVANSFYDLATDFYEPFSQAIARHEHFLASSMGIKSNFKVLDIGCGVGGPAREIGHFTGAHITGLNNNDYQINRAKRYAVTFGLDKKSDFIKVMTDKYDPTNPEHLRIVRGLEVGNGIAKMMTIKDCLKALKTVGFNIEMNQDMGATDDKIKWYLPLQGDIRQANAFWDYLTFLRTTTAGRATTTYMLKALEKIGVVAPGSAKVSSILQYAAGSVLDGAKLGIFTPNVLLCCS